MDMSNDRIHINNGRDGDALGWRFGLHGFFRRVADMYMYDRLMINHEVVDGKC